MPTTFRGLRFSWPGMIFMASLRLLVDLDRRAVRRAEADAEGGEPGQDERASLHVVTERPQDAADDDLADGRRVDLRADADRLDLGDSTAGTHQMSSIGVLSSASSIVESSSTPSSSR